MLRHRWLDRSAEERVHLHVLARGLGTTGFARNPVLLVLFPSPFLLRGSRGKFSFPLPFSLTLQTATRRLLTTHPYSSDFPFVFSVVCVSPAVTRLRGKLPLLPSGQNQTKKDPLAPSQKVLIRHKKKAHRLSMRHRHLKKSKQTSVKNNSYKSPTKFLQNCRRLDKANNLRPEATRGGFAATPLTVSRKQMFIPVHAKRGGFTAPFFIARPETATSRGFYPIPRSFRGLKSRKGL